MYNKLKSVNTNQQATNNALLEKPLQNMVY